MELYLFVVIAVVLLSWVSLYMIYKGKLNKDKKPYSAILLMFFGPVYLIVRKYGQKRGGLVTSREIYMITILFIVFFISLAIVILRS
jgi:hypothetical protein